MAEKYGLLFGFNKNNIDEVGFLRIMPSGEHGSNGQYDIVDDESLATKLHKRKTSKDGIASWPASKVCKFMNSEEELSDWKFHVVWRTYNG